MLCCLFRVCVFSVCAFKTEPHNNNFGKLKPKPTQFNTKSQQQELGDTTTLAEPEVITELIANHCFNK